MLCLTLLDELDGCYEISVMNENEFKITTLIKLDIKLSKALLDILYLREALGNKTLVRGRVLWC